jgi:hypothetical protein
MAHGPGTEKKNPSGLLLFCGAGMDAVPQPLMGACSSCSFRWSPSPHERMDGRGGVEARTHRVALLTLGTLSSAASCPPHGRVAWYCQRGAEDWGEQLRWTRGRPAAMHADDAFGREDRRVDVQTTRCETMRSRWERERGQRLQWQSKDVAGLQLMSHLRISSGAGGEQAQAGLNSL